MTDPHPADMGSLRSSPRHRCSPPRGRSLGVKRSKEGGCDSAFALRRLLVRMTAMSSSWLFWERYGDGRDEATRRNPESGRGTRKNGAHG